MANKLNVDRIWWRNVQPGEFYNIERYHQIAGGGGSLYIEIPRSIVSDTLEFLNAAGTDVDTLPVITIEARAIGARDLIAPIEFQRKTGGRMRIARQNRQQPNSQRHPAWTDAFGFPKAPDTVGSKEDALPYFPNGGLRIYIAKTFDGDYYAGFTAGPLPPHIRPGDPWAALYPVGNTVGGVIHGN